MKFYAVRVRPRSVHEGDFDFDRTLGNASVTVHEPENNSDDTGIVDVRGNKIMSISQTEPVGFVPVK